MEPPILQWKVMAALLAVVVAGTILGSALHTTTPIARGVASYGPGSRFHILKPANCKTMQASLPVSKKLRPFFRRAIRQACHKHR